MNKTIKFINEKSVEEAIQYIKDNNVNVNNVIEKSKASRTEYGLKVQELIDKLSVTGDVWMAEEKEYCQSCAAYGISAEIFNNGVISRCLRCNKSTDKEMSGKEYIKNKSNKLVDGI